MAAVHVRSDSLRSGHRFYKAGQYGVRQALAAFTCRGATAFFSTTACPERAERVEGEDTESTDVFTASCHKGHKGHRVLVTACPERSRRVTTTLRQAQDLTAGRTQRSTKDTKVKPAAGEVIWSAVTRHRFDMSRSDAFRRPPTANYSASGGPIATPLTQMAKKKAVKKHRGGRAMPTSTRTASASKLVNLIFSLL